MLTLPLAETTTLKTFLTVFLQTSTDSTAKDVTGTASIHSRRPKPSRKSTGDWIWRTELGMVGGGGGGEDGGLRSDY